MQQLRLLPTYRLRYQQVCRTSGALESAELGGQALLDWYSRYGLVNYF